MTTAHLIQYALGAAALAVIVASEVLSWGLSAPVLGALFGLAGWLMAKRPSELLASEN